MRLVVIGLLLAACTNPAPPTPTKAQCPTPDPGTLTWESFGQKFMADYCTVCHASDLKHAARNGAPLYHDYDTLMGVLEIPDHIDSYAGSGPAAHNVLMPPGQCPTVPGGPLNRNCPEPTDAERTDLATWIACERLRPH
jgi:hypothetical protein